MATQWTRKGYMFIPEAKLAQANQAAQDAVNDGTLSQADLDAQLRTFDNGILYTHPTIGNIKVANLTLTPDLLETWKTILDAGNLDSGVRKARYMMVNSETFVMERARWHNFPASANIVVGNTYTFDQAAAALGLTYVEPPDN